VEHASVRAAALYRFALAARGREGLEGSRVAHSDAALDRRAVERLDAQVQVAETARRS
jgi:hypothetical protein